MPQLANRTAGLDAKMDMLIRDVGRLEGLNQGLYGTEVISNGSKLSGPEHVTAPEQHHQRIGSCWHRPASMA